MRRSNTGAVRDTEEETCLLAFELDLEKKAVSPSCQISLTVMPPSFGAQTGLAKNPIHLLTPGFRTFESGIFITSASVRGPLGRCLRRPFSVPVLALW